MCNADLRIGEIRQFCELPEDPKRLIRTVRSQLSLSAPAYHARAHDCPSRGAEEIQSADLPEALQYRPKSGVEIGISSNKEGEISGQILAGFAKMHTKWQIQSERLAETWQTVGS